MNFSVYMMSGDTENFKGNSSYHVSDAGVLRVLRHDRSCFVYPPHAWVRLRQEPGPDARDYEDDSALYH